MTAAALESWGFFLSNSDAEQADVQNMHKVLPSSLLYCMCGFDWALKKCISSVMPHSILPRYTDPLLISAAHHRWTGLYGEGSRKHWIRRCCISSAARACVCVCVERGWLCVPIPAVSQGSEVLSSSTVLRTLREQLAAPRSFWSA